MASIKGFLFKGQWLDTNGAYNDFNTFWCTGIQIVADSMYIFEIIVSQVENGVFRHDHKSESSRLLKVFHLNLLKKRA